LAATGSEEINFCMRCGTRLTQAERFGRQRPVCPACEWIYFADPKVAAVALLVRRAFDPQRGLWTLPGGFVDAGEDPARAVERECLEETGLYTQVTGLVDVLYGQQHPRGAHILIAYRAEMLSGRLKPGDDVDQAAFFERQELPPLAFEHTHKILGLA
jgi:ADP-ribose pyrophosphatase YjhB (NUDIX family)